ncbi:MAG: argininosuccinate synthase [Armatimonadetes bacterium]|nr:argininosuccinate synthase [Armatimonadota bacterium]
MSDKTAVLVYSGGLDTTVCIPLMRERYGFDKIVTVTVDVGQPSEDVQDAAERARALNAEHYTVDAKAEFASDYCFPAIAANADYQGYPLSTSIARPLIAAKAVETAKTLSRADAFVHGCTGKGNDQFRIEFMIRALMPEAQIIAPMRELNMTRTEEIEYARSHGAPIHQSSEKIWSIDENLWGRSVEGGRLEDPSYAPPEEIFQWTVDPTKAPDHPQEIEIRFDQGRPVALDGQSHSPLEMIVQLNRIAGAHGIGRIDIMEDRMIGLKVRENYECPAAVTLITAHRALEALVCAKDELRFKEQADRAWAELAYAGLWIDPFKASLKAFIQKVQERATGTVRLRLYKGSARVIGRESRWALYDENLASFDTTDFDQSEMAGAVKAHGLAARLYRRLSQG